MPSLLSYHILSPLEKILWDGEFTLRSDTAVALGSQILPYSHMILSASRIRIIGRKMYSPRP